MKRFILGSLKNTGVICVVLLGLFLIAYSILSGSGLRGKVAGLINGDDNQTSEQSKLPEPSLPELSGREVRNYVLFTYVPFDGRQVVTGVRYDSTRTNKIGDQWCYLDNNRSDGGQSSRLNLARVSKAGAKTITQFTPEALSTFALTRQTALKLAASHCRFQKQITPKKSSKGKPHVKPSKRPAVRRHAWPASPRKRIMERSAYLFHRPECHCAASERNYLSASM